LLSVRPIGVKIGRHWRILGAALLNLPGADAESETGLVSDWLAAASRTLREVWDNEEDAVYGREELREGGCTRHADN
jgi:hypothetical protein